MFFCELVSKAKREVLHMKDGDWCWIDAAVSNFKREWTKYQPHFLNSQSNFNNVVYGKFFNVVSKTPSLKYVLL